VAKISVTAASDDLIEIRGDISEEFSWFAANSDDERRYLGFSDGTVLSVQYDDDGIWRFSRVATGSANFTKIEGDVAADKNDEVVLEGDVAWCLFGKAFEPAR
jgi:hypothetical protein